jgi:hypothetical protein
MRKAILCCTDRQASAFAVQSFLFAKHKARASLKQQRGHLWALEYHPAQNGLPLEEARAIAVAFLAALWA